MLALNHPILSLARGVCRVAGSLLLSFALVTGAQAQAPGYATLADAPEGRYTLEKTHAYIAISYSHQGFSNPILLFRGFDTELVLDPSDIASSSLTVDIDPASIDSGVAEFDEHLVGKDMFDVANHPDAGFEATSISAAGGEGRYTVEGNLTLKSVTKPIVLDVQFNKGDMHFQAKKPHLGFTAIGQIKSSEWDLVADNEV